MSYPYPRSTSTTTAEAEPWWERRWIRVGQHKVNSLWHCFGVEHETVSLETAIAMLDASRTALLPINTHALRRHASRDALLIGHGDVSFDAFRAAYPADRLVLCLNINLQTRAADAVELAVLARELSGISLLKLEVLRPDLRTSNDEALLDATRELTRRGGFTIMPLLSANVCVAEKLIGLGVPLLRVMGSPIGSRRGVEDPDALREIVSLGVPVIVDGGLGSVDDLVAAVELGAAGGLINSLLFAEDDPARTMAEFVEHLGHCVLRRELPAKARR
jgi:thiazole synthase ThiGH ThiG subunit